MVKVSELRDAELDYFVALAEGVPKDQLEISSIMTSGQRLDCIKKDEGGFGWEGYMPSKRWEDGGPLLEKYELGCAFDRPGVWLAVRATGPNYDTSLWAMLRSEGQETEGSTALEAICRAVVKAKFGDEVEGI